MLKLALRNIIRWKMRSAMVLAAIVVSVVGLILSGGFVHDIFVQLGESIIHSQSGHLQVARSGFFVEGSRKPEKYLITDASEVARRVSSVDGVDDVMARLDFSGLLNNGRSDLAIVGEGIEPAHEARLGTYLVIKAGRQLEATDHYAILLGSGVARSLQLSPGDRVTLLVSTPEGAVNNMELTVAGVFESFSNDYDARTVKLPLVAAQELLDTKAANVLVVSLQRTSDTARVAAALRGLTRGHDLEVRGWQALNDYYEKTVDLYDRQLGVLSVIVLLMAFLSVTSMINLTVFERTGEVGTMRAMGNRGSFVFRLLIVESAMLGLFGVAVGTAFGVALALLISAIGIPMPPPPNASMGYVATVRLVPSVIENAIAVGLFATIGGCLLPARRLSRIPIAEALRHNV
jgi:putative ABC transport system permease protein